MKYIYKYVAITLLLLGIAPLSAEGATPGALRFISDTFDYGHIAEDGGPQRGRFEAVNSSSSDIHIQEIVTTCGCTTATYEQSTVAAGEGFSFDVVFDPMNRPGRIDKSIYVYTSDSSEPIRLRIVGYVQPRERTTAELYPFDIGGGLRLASNFHAFGYIEAGKSAEERIGFINTSKHTITLHTQVVEGRGLLTVETPESIAPGTSGDIVLRYDNTPTTPIYGALRDRIVLFVNGNRGSYDISTYAITVDNFDSMDDISAPRLAISKNIIKFGEVNGHSEVMERNVELRNEGASPLLVRAIECEARAVEVTCEVDSIAPGEGANIVLRLHSEHIEDWDNPFTTRVTVITNDPLRPMQTIKVSALPY